MAQTLVRCALLGIPFTIAIMVSDAESLIGEGAVRVLKRLLPDFVPIPLARRSDDEREQITSIDLPLAPAAEYYFRLYFSPEIQVVAQLACSKLGETYFWYSPFELAAYSNSIADAEHDFWEMIEVLLTHESRIIQKKGWLNWHFRCEYKLADRWKRVGPTIHSLRCQRLTPPPISGKQRIYYSGPLIQAVSPKS